MPVALLWDTGRDVGWSAMLEPMDLPDFRVTGASAPPNLEVTVGKEEVGCQELRELMASASFMVRGLCDERGGGAGREEAVGV